jgi:hypothetical protein
LSHQQILNTKAQDIPIAEQNAREDRSIKKEKTETAYQPAIQRLHGLAMSPLYVHRIISIPHRVTYWPPSNADCGNRDTFIT